jgi:hypothetical protein
MDAIDLLARYAGTDSDQKLYAAGEKVPIDGVIPKAWLDGVIDDDGRVERIPYELCVLIASRARAAGRTRTRTCQATSRTTATSHYAVLATLLVAAATHQLL